MRTEMPGVPSVSSSPQVWVRTAVTGWGVTRGENWVCPVLLTLPGSVGSVGQRRHAHSLMAPPHPLRAVASRPPVASSAAGGRRKGGAFSGKNTASAPLPLQGVVCGLEPGSSPLSCWLEPDWAPEGTCGHRACRLPSCRLPSCPAPLLPCSLLPCPFPRAPFQWPDAWLCQACLVLSRVLGGVEIV